LNQFFALESVILSANPFLWALPSSRVAALLGKGLRCAQGAEKLMQRGLNKCPQDSMKEETRIVAGFPIRFRIGQNRLENAELIEAAHPDDLWFHLAGRPSCHVLTTLPVRKVRGLVIRQGAAVCRDHMRCDGSESVVCSRVRDLVRTDVPGTVGVPM
jgi:hypothetical protein